MMIWERTNEMTLTEWALGWLREWASITPVQCEPKTAEILMNFMGKADANYGNL